MTARPLTIVMLVVAVCSIAHSLRAEPAIEPVIQLGHSDRVADHRLTLDGNWLLTAGNGEVFQWNAKTGDLVRSYRADSIQTTPDGEMLLAIDEQSRPPRPTFFSLETGQSAEPIAGLPLEVGYHPLLTTDGRYVVFFDHPVWEKSWVWDRVERRFIRSPGMGHLTEAELAQEWETISKSQEAKRQNAISAGFHYPRVKFLHAIRPDGKPLVFNEHGGCFLRGIDGQLNFSPLGDFVLLRFYDSEEMQYDYCSLWNLNSLSPVGTFYVDANQSNVFLFDAAGNLVIDAVVKSLVHTGNRTFQREKSGFLEASTGKLLDEAPGYSGIAEVQRDPSGAPIACLLEDGARIEWGSTGKSSYTPGPRAELKTPVEEALRQVENQRQLLLTTAEQGGNVFRIADVQVREFTKLRDVGLNNHGMFSFDALRLESYADRLKWPAPWKRFQPDVQPTAPTNNLVVLTDEPFGLSLQMGWGQNSSRQPEVSPDGKREVTWKTIKDDYWEPDDILLTVRELPSRRIIREWHVAADTIESVHFFAGAQRLLLITETRQDAKHGSFNTCQAWEVATGKRLWNEPQVYEQQRTQAINACISPDDRWLCFFTDRAFGPDSGRLVVFNADNFKKQCELPCDVESHPGSAAFSANGKYLVARTQGSGSHLIDVEGGFVMGKFEEQTLFMPSPNREVLWSWRDGGALHSLRTGATLTSALAGVNNYDQSLDGMFGLSGRRFVSGQKRIRVAEDYQDVPPALWSLDSGETIVNLTADLQERVLAASFTPDGQRLLAILGWQNDLQRRGPADKIGCLICDAETGETVAKQWAPAERTIGANWVSQSGFVLLGDAFLTTFGELAILWDAETAKPRSFIREPAGGSVQNSISPSGTRLLTSQAGGSATVWDLATGEVIQQLDDPQFPSNGRPQRLTSEIRFSGDGESLVCLSHSNRAVHRFSLKTGKWAASLYLLNEEGLCIVVDANDIAAQTANDFVKYRRRGTNQFAD